MDLKHFTVIIAVVLFNLAASKARHYKYACTYCNTDDECPGGVCRTPEVGNINKKKCFQCQCSQNYQCYLENKDMICNCTGSGYSGELCDKDVDECSSGEANCDQEATCTNTVGSFQCKCNQGWTGDGISCTECYRGSMCINSTVNTEGSCNYVCRPGWTGVGTNCTVPGGCLETYGTTECVTSLANAGCWCDSSCESALDCCLDAECISEEQLGYPDC